MRARSRETAPSSSRAQHRRHEFRPPNTETSTQLTGVTAEVPAVRQDNIQVAPYWQGKKFEQLSYSQEFAYPIDGSSGDLRSQKVAVLSEIPAKLRL